MELLNPEVTAYLETLIPLRPPELEAMESDAAATGFPIIGPVAGHFCYLMTRLTGARRVFEMGSGFGYSTAFFARGVRENGGGVVHHVVWDEDLSARARRHLGALGLADLVEFHVREAVEALDAADPGFDLIFNDIDKAAYPDSLPVIKKRLRPGGTVIIDNALWHGRILDHADDSPATAGVRELTRLIKEDPDWSASLVPLRDGLLVARLAGD